MKQNIYDTSSFFKKYSDMTRSKKGLAGAGEWHVFQRMLPSLKDKNILDLGCGYGWHCQYAVEKGAKSVTGVDISEKMLKVAKEKTSSTIEYICQPIEDVSFPERNYDVVLSSLAFHYLDSFQSIATKVYKWLNEEGVFVFSVEHPIFTSSGSQDWYYDEKGNVLHFPVDNYFYEGKRNANFLGENVTKYHRTLTTYISTLLKLNFEITAVVEPQPSKEMLDNSKSMQNELRRPMMLIISASKKHSEK